MSVSEPSSGMSKRFAERLDEYFGITARGSTIRTEVKGGVITFLAMSYILIVNPNILGTAAVGYGYNFNQLFTATALAAIISCLLMGLYSRFPVALAPGMGLKPSSPTQSAVRWVSLSSRDS